MVRLGPYSFLPECVVRRRHTLRDDEVRLGIIAVWRDDTLNSFLLRDVMYV